MRAFLLGSLFAASFVFAGAAQAVPADGLPVQVCTGPAGDRNPNCRVNGGGEAAVPEPGAAGVFALGTALIALRQRRPR